MATPTTIKRLVTNAGFPPRKAGVESRQFGQPQHCSNRLCGQLIGVEELVDGKTVAIHYIVGRHRVRRSLASKVWKECQYCHTPFALRPACPLVAKVGQLRYNRSSCKQNNQTGTGDRPRIQHEMHRQ